MRSTRRHRRALPGGGHSRRRSAPTLNRTPVSVPPTAAHDAAAVAGTAAARRPGRAAPPPPPAARAEPVTVTTAHSSGLSLLGWVVLILGLVAAGTLVDACRGVGRGSAAGGARRRGRSEPAEQVAGAWTEVLDHLRAAGHGLAGVAHAASSSRRACRCASTRRWSRRSPRSRPATPPSATAGTSPRPPRWTRRGPTPTRSSGR